MSRKYEAFSENSFPSFQPNRHGSLPMISMLSDQYNNYKADVINSTLKILVISFA